VATVPSPEAVRLHLSSVLASPEFNGSQMACKFLGYGVDQTLAGRADGLKEYAIGREACGRGADFDPRLDPVVRVQASKLRARLSAYYQSGGATEPIESAYPRDPIPEFRLVTPRARTLRPRAKQGKRRHETERGSGQGVRRRG
jgi:hypothetical protein